MTTTTYEPDLYDLTTPVSFRGDLEFYRRKAKESGGPVLDARGRVRGSISAETHESLAGISFDPELWVTSQACARSGASRECAERLRHFLASGLNRNGDVAPP